MIYLELLNFVRMGSSAASPTISFSQVPVGLAALVPPCRYRLFRTVIRAD
jgi:hypothetical protein